jgi:hypothetical protein
MSDSHEHYARDIYVNPEDAAGSFGYLPGILSQLVARQREPVALPKLDEECSCVYANNDMDPAPDCERCQGSGYRLTEAGRALLAFLQRHPPALTRT